MPHEVLAAEPHSPITMNGAQYKGALPAQIIASWASRKAAGADWPFW